MQLKKLKIHLIALLLIIPSGGINTYAEETVNEDPVLVCIEKCDVALEKKDKVIALQDLAIKDAKKIRALDKVEIEGLHNKLNSPLRNPFIMVTLGLVTGLILGKVVLK